MDCLHLYVLRSVRFNIPLRQAIFSRQECSEPLMAMIQIASKCIEFVSLTVHYRFTGNLCLFCLFVSLVRSLSLVHPLFLYLYLSL